MIHVVAAVGTDGVIGRKGRLPWRVPEELRHFKALTLGRVVIMGRTTYESLGAPLAGRRNLVLSRQNLSVLGAETFSSLAAALQVCEADGHDAYVIGGAQVYREGVAVADRLHISEVAGEYTGDVHFPLINLKEWRLVERTPFSSFNYLHYARA